MKKYTEAAQTAHDNLLPQLAAAIANALERIKKARADADTKTVTPLLRVKSSLFMPHSGIVSSGVT